MHDITKLYTLKDSLKVQQRLMDFNIKKYKNLIDMASDPILNN